MITVKKDNINFAFDSAYEPCAWAEDGDTVKFQCQYCYCEQILIGLAGEKFEK